MFRLTIPIAIATRSRRLCAVLALTIALAAPLNAEMGHAETGRQSPADILSLADIDNQPLVARATTAASMMRIAAISDAGQIDVLFGDGRAVFDPELPQLDMAETRQIWADFFVSASIFVGAAQSADPVIAFYNPIADFWLLTQWVGASGRPALRAAELWPGELLETPTLSAARIAVTPRWLTGTGDQGPLDGLQQSASAAWRAFQAFAPGADESAPDITARGSRTLIRTIFRNRMAGLVASRDILSDKPRLGAFHVAVSDALEAGDLTTLTRLSASADAQELAELAIQTPELLRQHLAPVFALTSEKRLVILSASVQQARTLALTDYGAPEGRFGLSGVAVFDVYQKADQP